MIAERTIREALFAPRAETIPVRAHERSRPICPKKLATHKALGLDLGSFRASRSIPTEREGWFVGQRVWIEARGWSSLPGRTVTVDRVTPSGRAVVGLSQYDRDGYQIGGSTGRYGRERIEPLTDDHLARLEEWKKQQEVAALADGVRWKDLTGRDLQVALELLRALKGS